MEKSTVPPLDRYAEFVIQHDHSFVQSYRLCNSIGENATNIGSAALTMTIPPDLSPFPQRRVPTAIIGSENHFIWVKKGLDYFRAIVRPVPNRPGHPDSIEIKFKPTISGETDEGLGFRHPHLQFQAECD